MSVGCKESQRQEIRKTYFARPKPTGESEGRSINPFEMLDKYLQERGLGVICCQTGRPTIVDRSNRQPPEIANFTDAMALAFDQLMLTLEVVDPSEPNFVNGLRAILAGGEGIPFDLAEESLIFGALARLISVRKETKLEHVLSVLPHFALEALEIESMRELLRQSDLNSLEYCFSAMVYLLIVGHDAGAALMIEVDSQSSDGEDIFSILKRMHDEGPLQIKNDYRQFHAVLSAILMDDAWAEIDSRLKKANSVSDSDYESFNPIDFEKLEKFRAKAFDAVRYHHLVEQIDKENIHLEEAVKIFEEDPVKFIMWFSLFIADTLAAMNRFTTQNVKIGRQLTDELLALFTTDKLVRKVIVDILKRADHQLDKDQRKISGQATSTNGSQSNSIYVDLAHILSEEEQKLTYMSSAQLEIKAWIKELEPAQVEV